MNKRPYVRPAIKSRPLAPRDSERVSERRAVRRYPFSANAVIVELVTRTELTTRTSEIGLGGCYIEGVDEFRKDSVLQIEIVVGGDKFQTRGRVAYVHPAVGMGIAFLEPEPKQKRTIARWIAHLPNRRGKMALPAV